MSKLYSTGYGDQHTGLRWIERLDHSREYFETFVQFISRVEELDADDWGWYDSQGRERFKEFEEDEDVVKKDDVVPNKIFYVTYPDLMTGPYHFHLGEVDVAEMYTVDTEEGAVTEIARLVSEGYERDWASWGAHPEEFEEEKPDFEDNLNGVLDEIREIMISRHEKYGPGNIASCPMGAKTGILVRLHDKMARLVNLVKNGKGSDVEDESELDTWTDVAGYGIIGLMWSRGMWPGQNEGE